MPQLIPTAQRVMEVFEVFAKEERPLTNSEMARYLNLADSSCSDLLYTLRQSGYLLRTPRSRYFFPTGRLHEIAGLIAASDPMQQFASEALEMLTRKSGETSMCGHMDGDNIKVFACHQSMRALRYVLQPGVILNLHSTALGKALLGAMPIEERHATIERLKMQKDTPASITDRDELNAQIDANLAEQCFTARGEGSEGVYAIGTAGMVGGRLTAFSIVGPVHRVEKNLTEYKAILMDARKDFFGE